MINSIVGTGFVAVGFVFLTLGESRADVSQSFSHPLFDTSLGFCAVFVDYFQHAFRAGGYAFAAAVAK
jgi:hypothetical protein